MSGFKGFLKSKRQSVQIQPVIFAIDVSEKVSAQCIEQIYSSLRLSLDKFSEYNRYSNSNTQIKVAVLRLSGKPEWIIAELEDPSAVALPPMIAGGGIDYNAAFGMLDQKLSKEGWFSNGSYLNPFICYITRCFNADDNYSTLEILNCNPWYKKASKSAVIIGNEELGNRVKSLVGDSESIVHLSSGLVLKFVLFGLYDTFLNIDLIDSRVVLSRNTSNTGALFSSSKDDETSERRKKLAESLRNGEEVKIDHSHKKNQTNNVPLRPPQYSMPPIQVPNGKLAGGVHPPIPSASAYCKLCGRSVLSGSKYCSNCGNPVLSNNKELTISQVQFSAIVPKHFIKGDYSIIDIAVYEEEYRNIVDRIISSNDSETKEIIASAQNVAENTSVRIKLSSPDVNIIDGDETQIWQGRYLSFSFAVGIPSDYEKKQILFIATVYFDDLIATRLKFLADCSSLREQKIRLIREDILTAFISYASQDRNRVATLIQGMKKARPDMDIFFDVDSLRSGDDWEKSLKREIEKRDVLFLCWSPFAKASKWVETEWRYALSINGIESIEPVPLVPPSECPPPDELKSKHFNDRSLLYQERISNETETSNNHPSPRLMRKKTHEVIVIDKPVFRVGKERSHVDYYIGDNTAISRCHVNIISKDNNFFIVDTNSTNRTYINGVIIPSNVETPIYHQTKIRLANEDFEFLLF